MQPALTRLFAPLAALLLPLLLAVSCGGPGSSGEELSQAPSVESAKLPFPLDSPHYSRQLAALETLNGLQSYSNCGAPGFAAHASVADVAVLESSEEQSTAWAIYRFPLNINPELLSINISLYKGNLDSKYYLLLADYNSNRWQNMGERFGSRTLLPADWEGLDLTSPAKYCYVALVVVDGRHITIASINTENTDVVDPEYPIFDQYEDNDTMLSCTPIVPGQYIASTHDTYIPEMAEIGEGQDIWDFYCIDLNAGDKLTLTLENEIYNHMLPDNPVPNDLDVLVYNPGVPTDDPLNDFNVPLAEKLRIHFFNMEHLYYVVPTSGTYRFGIRGDLETKATAEYDFRVYVTNDPHTVSGNITQDGQLPDKEFLVVLTPGNFNAVSSIFDSDRGHFVIEGVPDGSYTMEVRGSWAFGQDGYTYPNTKEIVVSGFDVNQSMSIDPYPG